MGQQLSLPQFTCCLVKITFGVIIFVLLIINKKLTSSLKNHSSADRCNF